MVPKNEFLTPVVACKTRRIRKSFASYSANGIPKMGKKVDIGPQIPTTGPGAFETGGRSEHLRCKLGERNFEERNFALIPGKIWGGGTFNPCMPCIPGSATPALRGRRRGDD